MEILLSLCHLPKPPLSGACFHHGPRLALGLNATFTAHAPALFGPVTKGGLERLLLWIEEDRDRLLLFVCLCVFCGLLAKNYSFELSEHWQVLSPRSMLSITLFPLDKTSQF